MKNLIRIWVLCLSLAICVGAVVVAFSVLHAGATVVYRDGEYVLVQGRRVERIGQRSAVIVRIASILFATIGCAAVVLTVLIKQKTGSMNPYVVTRWCDSESVALMRVWNAAFVIVMLIGAAVVIALLMRALQ